MNSCSIQIELRQDSGMCKYCRYKIITVTSDLTVFSFLVRDSAARLPNGEGTRGDICELLKDSQFLAPAVTDAQVVLKESIMSLRVG